MSNREILLTAAERWSLEKKWKERIHRIAECPN